MRESKTRFRLGLLPATIVSGDGAVVLARTLEQTLRLTPEALGRYQTLAGTMTLVVDPSAQQTSSFGRRKLPLDQLCRISSVIAKNAREAPEDAILPRLLMSGPDRDRTDDLYTASVASKTGG